jgi:hypothetical protein
MNDGRPDSGAALVVPERRGPTDGGRAWFIFWTRFYSVKKYEKEKGAKG